MLKTFRKLRKILICDRSGQAKKNPRLQIYVVFELPVVSIISPSCPRNPCHRSSTPGARTSSVGVLVLVLLVVVVGGGGGVDVAVVTVVVVVGFVVLVLVVAAVVVNQETMEGLGLQQVLCKLNFCQRTHAISMICLCKTLMFQVCSAGTVS